MSNIDKTKVRNVVVGVFAVLLLIFGAVFMFGGSVFGFEKVKIEQGYTGIRFKTVGQFKSEVLGSGYYLSTPGTDIKVFPIFQQNYVYTKSKEEGKPIDESFQFSIGSVIVNANIALSYHVDPTKIPLIYQKYQSDLKALTSGPIRSSLRNSFNNRATKYSIDSMMYSTGKSLLLAEVKKDVSTEFGPLGIVVDNIYLVGDFEYPPQIIQSIVAKNNASQQAQIQENSVRIAKATAEKNKVEAEGAAAVAVATAKGQADAVVIAAEGQAKAIRLETQALSPTYIEYTKAKAWDGKLPQVTGGATPMIDMRK